MNSIIDQQRELIPIDQSSYKKLANVKPAIYGSYYPLLKMVANWHGYALAIHGSMGRDLDLIAIPWIDDAKAPLDLIKALCDEIGGTIAGGETYGGTKKPHGRVAWSIYLWHKDWEEYGKNYLDISVMPRL